MINRVSLQSTLLLAATFAAGMLSAEEWEVTGFVGLDTQAFWHDGQYRGQDDSCHKTFL